MLAFATILYARRNSSKLGGRRASSVKLIAPDGLVINAAALIGAVLTTAASSDIISSWFDPRRCALSHLDGSEFIFHMLAVWAWKIDG